MCYKKILFIIAILWLIELSLFPRIVEVISNNYNFLIDQGRDYMAVKDIIVNHKPTLIGAEVGSGMAGLSGLFHGPFYFYLLGISFIIFGGDPYGGLLVMFILGLLTILIGFFFGRKVMGIYGGLLVAFLIALSPPIIAQSRFIWSPHPASLFILLAFYFVYLSYERKKLYLFLAAFLTGFIYNFEFAMAVPMSIAVFLYILFVLRKELRLFPFAVMGFLAAYSPLLLFEIKHGFSALKGFGNYFSHSSKVSMSVDFNPFLHNFSDTFPAQSIVPPLSILVFFILGVAYFMLIEKNKKIRNFIFFLSLTYVITFVIMAFVKTHIFEYYLIHLNFITIFLFSYLVVRAHEKQHAFFKILFAIFLGVFLFYGTANSIQVTKYDLHDYGGMVKMKGKLDVIDYIYRDAKGEQFGLLVFSPPVYTYPYEYLMWWYGQKKYNYIPHKEKKGMFYLLIEKDLSEPWTYKGWLETVVKTGKVVKTKELPSGFIIQKRIDE